MPPLPAAAERALDVDIDLLRPNKFQPRTHMDDGAHRGTVAIDPLERRDPADRRAQGRHRLRDRRRRAALARIAACRPPQSADRRPRHPRRRAARRGADREHPARGPQPDRRSARLSPPRRRVRPDAGADRRIGRQGSIVGRQLRAAAAAARRSSAITSAPDALSMGHARALLGLPDEAAQLRVGREIVAKGCRCARPKRS